MIKGETVRRGGAGGEDYHHGQGFWGASPPKYNLEASPLNSLNLIISLSAHTSLASGLGGLSPLARCRTKVEFVLKSRRKKALALTPLVIQRCSDSQKNRVIQILKERSFRIIFALFNPAYRSCLQQRSIRLQLITSTKILGSLDLQATDLLGILVVQKTNNLNIFLECSNHHLLTAIDQH